MHHKCSSVDNNASSGQWRSGVWRQAKIAEASPLHAYTSDITITQAPSHLHGSVAGIRQWLLQLMRRLLRLLLWRGVMLPPLFILQLPAVPGLLLHRRLRLLLHLVLLLLLVVVLQV